MKVIKSQDVPQNAPTNGQPDQAQIAQLQEKFDALRSEIETKFYSVYMDKDQTKFLFEEVYPSIEWKGYESYAVSETYKQFEASRTGEGINAKFPVEVIEASFHFLKNHVGKGFELAVPFKQICDQFAVTIQEINKDRQSLKDISLELVSAEQGIKVEDLVEAMNKHAQSQQNQQY